MVTLAHGEHRFDRDITGGGPDRGGAPAAPTAPREGMPSAPDRATVHTTSDRVHGLTHGDDDRPASPHALPREVSPMTALWSEPGRRTVGPTGRGPRTCAGRIGTRSARGGRPPVRWPGPGGSGARPCRRARRRGGRGRRPAPCSPPWPCLAVLCSSAERNRWSLPRHRFRSGGDRAARHTPSGPATPCGRSPSGSNRPPIRVRWWPRLAAQTGSDTVVPGERIVLP